MAQFIACNGRVIHYAHRRGTGGLPIVFANSLGTDLRIWDSVLDLVPADIPVLRHDKRGHGLSEAGPVDIAQLAADLAALMDALGLGRALICGVSIGGMIAQQLAAARPDLVAGLVLSNTSYRIGDTASWSQRIDALESGGLDPLADGILERWFSAAFRRDAPATVAGYRAMLTRTPLRTYIATCAAIRDADLQTAASEIACPTLCVAGGEDHATLPARVRALADCITGARYTCLGGVGHLPGIEAPEAMADLVMDLHRGLT